MLALALDFGGPYFFGVEGWQLVPGHFAERHGLIIIIALGESIVEIGAGAAGHLDLGIGVAAVLGVGVAAAMWWVYFDVVALVSARRLAEAEEGREQNALARDSYSYLHLFLVAGIVLTAFGLKTAIAHTGEHLHWVPSFAAARRDRALPARPGRLPLPPADAPGTATNWSPRRVLLVLIPLGDGDPGAGHAGDRDRAARRPGRLRARRLRRAPRRAARPQHDDRGGGRAGRRRRGGVAPLTARSPAVTLLKDL